MTPSSPPRPLASSQPPPPAAAQAAAPAPVRVELPLPPTDNHCHTTARNPKTGQPIRRATDDYLTWIRQASILVRRAHHGPPDASNWWHVEIDLFLPPRHGDAQNYIKPLLDILSGAVVTTNNRSERIEHAPVGVWDDDRRIASLNLRLHAVGVEPIASHAIVTATPTSAPHIASPTMAARQARTLRGPR